jgi:hypothetical protein
MGGGIFHRKGESLLRVDHITGHSICPLFIKATLAGTCELNMYMQYDRLELLKNKYILLCLYTLFAALMGCPVPIQPPPVTVHTGLLFTGSVTFLLSSPRLPDAVHSASLLYFFTSFLSSQRPPDTVHSASILSFFLAT